MDARAQLDHEEHASDLVASGGGTALSEPENFLTFEWEEAVVIGVLDLEGWEILLCCDLGGGR
jgi:hypothetical protein